MKTLYTLVSGSDGRLAENVQEKLDAGWMLHNAPFGVSCGSSLYFYQAMTKEVKPEPVRGTRGTGARGMT